MRVALPVITLLVCLGLFVSQTKAQQAPSAPSVQQNTNTSPPSSPNQGNSSADHDGTDQKAAILNASQPPKKEQAGTGGSYGANAIRTEGGDHDAKEGVIANFTIVLAIATIILAFATFGLYWETRRLATQAVRQSQDTAQALAISRESADAAKKSADAALMSAQSPRAWLAFERLDVGPLANIMIEGVLHDRALSFALTFGNKGGTPASNLVTNRHARVIENTDQTPHFEEPWIHDDNGVVAPGQFLTASPFPLFGQDLVDFEAGLKHVCVFVHAKYDDIFGNHRETTICMRAMQAGTVEVFPGMTQPRIESRAAGKQNRVT